MSLWQLHYKRIEEMRAHYNAALASAAQNVKGPARPGPDRITKIRSQFKTFLSEATGFYHDLMVKIRAKYGLSLGYMADDPQNDIALSKNGNKSIDVNAGLLSCHRCFIYLGDLARYKGLYGDGDSKTRDFATAASYYKQAATLWPSSGNPHHQVCYFVVTSILLFFPFSFSYLYGLILFIHSLLFWLSTLEMNCWLFTVIFAV